MEPGYSGVFFESFVSVCDVWWHPVACNNEFYFVFFSIFLSVCLYEGLQ